MLYSSGSEWPSPLPPVPGDCDLDENCNIIYCQCFLVKERGKKKNWIRLVKGHSDREALGKIMINHMNLDYFFSLIKHNYWNSKQK